MKIALGIEYSGFHYLGWQKQKTVLNVQGIVENALSKVANEEIKIICAGRTDTGVHGFGQVVHFETEVLRKDHAWLLGANTHLPADIRVFWVKKMPDDFHARFSAIAREYTYLLNNDPIKPALFHQHLAWHYKPLNLEAMQEAARYLIG